MKVWELKEGKIYKILPISGKYRLNGKLLEYKEDGKWNPSIAKYNDLVDSDFEEVINTNSHWKPENNAKFVFIETGFDSVEEDYLDFEEHDANMFHPDDKAKVECLALEFKIKSVLLNWRRLHDNVELDWEKETWKNTLTGDMVEKKVNITGEMLTLNNLFGHFSTGEKAEQFYNYMKSDIDKYFKMRKELKF